MYTLARWARQRHQETAGAVAAAPRTGSPSCCLKMSWKSLSLTGNSSNSAHLLQGSYQAACWLLLKKTRGGVCSAETPAVSPRVRTPRAPQPVRPHGWLWKGTQRRAAPGTSAPSLSAFCPSSTATFPQRVTHVQATDRLVPSCGKASSSSSPLQLPPSPAPKPGGTQAPPGPGQERQGAAGDLPPLPPSLLLLPAHTQKADGLPWAQLTLGHQRSQAGASR